ncbi:MAG: hypothetical protein ACI9KE_000802 [Polyangiales bacterium]
MGSIDLPIGLAWTYARVTRDKAQRAAIGVELVSKHADELMAVGGQEGGGKHRDPREGDAPAKDHEDRLQIVSSTCQPEPCASGDGETNGDGDRPSFASSSVIALDVFENDLIRMLCHFEGNIRGECSALPSLHE